MVFILQDVGHALRGLFIIDGRGVLRQNNNE